MRIGLQYPIFAAGYTAEVLEPDGIRRVVEAIEDAGIDAVAFTDHPAPPQRWLQTGGHDSLDPLAALAFTAGLTQRIRLLTYLLVLPYRNPFLAAKQISTVDVLSGGRVTLGIGSGYLRSEFAALGVDFAERNLLFEESVDVLRTIWTADSVQYRGRHFTADGQTSHPRPKQVPHPPLWVGGNSRRARERAAAWGQGWAPLMMDPRTARVTRTPAMTEPAQLAEAIGVLRRQTVEAGRDPDALDVCVQSMHPRLTMPSRPDQDSEWCRAATEIRDAGATWMVLESPPGSVSETVDTLLRFGQDVLPKL